MRGMDGEDITISDVPTTGSEGCLARIDQYRLEQELGGGGFGSVYLATDTVSGAKYAVKGLPPFVRASREELENIKENFLLVSQLVHTNIACAHVLHLARDVEYYSAEVKERLRVERGDTLMVMEFAPGVTLSRWRRQFPRGRVPAALALEVARQIAAAADYAHSRKVLHRDIKPSNAMVETLPDDKVAVRVVDFGLAAEIRSSMGRISREIRDTSGTRPYMAPEQWLGERQGSATDQYALAVLFHELIEGETPFASAFETGDPVVMLNAVTRKPYKAPRDMPPAMRKALERALSKKPGDRFPTCSAFVEALGGGRRRAAWPAAAAALAIVAAIAAATTFREKLRTQTPQPQTPQPPMQTLPPPVSKPTVATPKPKPVAEVPAPAPKPKPAAETPIPAPKPKPVAETPKPKPEQKPVVVTQAAPAPAPIAKPKPAAPIAPVATTPAPKPAPVAPVATPAPKPVQKPVVAPPAPPSLYIRAWADGKEVDGAWLRTMNGSIRLPGRWDEDKYGRLSKGRRISCEVEYYEGARTWSGRFETEIDWNGPREMSVQLSPGDGQLRPKPKGIGGWAF